MPFFSVVLPTYNRAHILKETISSVRNQLFEDWELIIIDDGSTDDTKGLIHDIMSLDYRVKYYYQENSERSVARNNGILKSKGKYICFLDSDDQYKENHLQEFFKYISTHNQPQAMIISSVTRIEKNEKKDIDIDIINDFHNSTCYFIQAKEGVIPSRVCVEKNIFDYFQFNPKIKDVEDTVLWCQISTRYDVLQHMNRTCFYNIHDSNSTNLSNNPFLNQLNGLKILFSYSKVRKKIPRSIRKHKLANCYMGITKYYLFKKDKLKVRHNTLKSLLNAPFNKSTKYRIKLLILGRS